MGYYESSYSYQRRAPSIFDGFTLRPLPYPVILILIVISLFLGFKFYFAYEEAVEETEAQFNWLLLITPLILVFAVKWLSSVQNPGGLFGFLPYNRRRVYHSGGAGSSEGGSPWGVAAFIVLLLVLVHYQSVFLDSWFI